MTRKRHRPKGTLALAAAISALAAPAATAVPAEQLTPRAEVDSVTGSSSVPPPPSSIAGAAAGEYENLRSPDATTVPLRVVEVQTDRGFDWGDAGIGAAGMLALGAMGAGAAVATGHRVRRLHAS
jgi:hypothetical protein